MKSFEISPSIIASDYTLIRDTLESIKKNNISWVHFDVMDGVFVPNITFGMGFIKDCRKVSDLFFDVHLMIESPEKYIEQFADAGSDLITFHLEATNDINECIKLIKYKNKKVGISIKPATKSDAIIPYLKDIDLILIMTVEPGFAGQKMIDDAIPKISETKNIICNSNVSNNILIQVDGGVCKDNYKKIIESGADVIVAGSAYFKGDFINS